MIERDAIHQARLLTNRLKRLRRRADNQVDAVMSAFRADLLAIVGASPASLIARVRAGLEQAGDDFLALELGNSLELLLPSEAEPEPPERQLRLPEVAAAPAVEARVRYSPCQGCQPSYGCWSRADLPCRTFVESADPNAAADAELAELVPARRAPPAFPRLPARMRPVLLEASEAAVAGEEEMETEDECCARVVREEMAEQLAQGRGPLDVLIDTGPSAEELAAMAERGELGIPRVLNPEAIGDPNATPVLDMGPSAIELAARVRIASSDEQRDAAHRAYLERISQMDPVMRLGLALADDPAAADVVLPALAHVGDGPPPPVTVQQSPPARTAREAITQVKISTDPEDWRQAAVPAEDWARELGGVVDSRGTFHPGLRYPEPGEPARLLEDGVTAVADP